jgi:hypothetical protein
MATTNATLSMQLDRLRGILARLAFVDDSSRQAELIEQARVSIAAVRTTRAALTAKAVWSAPARSGDNGNPAGAHPVA